MESKDLTIVIVTFKSDEKVINCLNSISDEIPIIIVENSNNKIFKSKIESSYHNVECILSGQNNGYSIANNIGLKRVKTKYALVLNPDTILSKDAIKNFLITARENKEFWLIGPANDQIGISHFENNLAEVKNLKGFAIFFNMSKFDNKFFDENFFLYFEEIDLCNQVIRKNGKIFLDQSITINHQGASSVKDINKIELEKNRNWHWMWSTFYFNKKHYGYFKALAKVSRSFLSSIIKMIYYFLILNKNKRKIYYQRFSGLFNSIIGNKSWYRPSLD